MLALVWEEIGLNVRVGEPVTVCGCQASSFMDGYTKSPTLVLQADADFSSDGIISLDTTFTVETEFTAAQGFLYNIKY